jgi:hypothetical protein
MMQRTHAKDDIMYKLTAFPKQVMLRDGTGVTVRPLSDSDADALLSFFKGVPQHER